MNTPNKPPWYKQLVGYFKGRKRQCFNVGKSVTTVNHELPLQTTAFLNSEIVSVAQGFRKNRVILLVVLAAISVLAGDIFFEDSLQRDGLYFAASILALAAWSAGFGKTSHFVAVGTAHGKLRFNVSDRNSVFLAQGLCERLAQLKGDQEGGDTSPLYLANSFIATDLVPQSLPDNYAAHYAAGLALEKGINCTPDLRRALQAYKSAVELGHPHALERLILAAERLHGPQEDFPITYPLTFILDEPRSAIFILTKSFYADNITYLFEKDARALAASGSPTTTLSLLSLSEISDELAEILSDYKGRQIQLSPKVKMSDDAAQLLAKHVVGAAR